MLHVAHFSATSGLMLAVRPTAWKVPIGPLLVELALSSSEEGILLTSSQWSNFDAVLYFDRFSPSFFPWISISFCLGNMKSKAPLSFDLLVFPSRTIKFPNCQPLLLITGRCHRKHRYPCGWASATIPLKIVADAWAIVEDIQTHKSGQNSSPKIGQCVLHINQGLW